MVPVTMLFFARARDLAGTERLTIDLPDGASVGDLRGHLASRMPQLAGLLQRSAFAVNGEFAENAQTLPVAAEVALLPPVSGG